MEGWWHPRHEISAGRELDGKIWLQVLEPAPRDRRTGVAYGLTRDEARELLQDLRRALEEGS